MLKKTEYFVSEIRAAHELQHCVNQAKEKRDKFLLKNTNSIASIDEEDIKVISNSNHTIGAIIRLSYFPKINE